MPEAQPTLTHTPELTTTGPYTYNHVPKLKELFRTNGGLPGVRYAQVCTSNAKAAQDDGWGPVENAKLFSIAGPKGTADIILACKGTPTRSGSAHDGARTMFLDHDIYRLTGLWLGELPDELQAEFSVDAHGESPSASAKTAGSAPTKSAGPAPTALADAVASVAAASKS